MTAAALAKVFLDMLTAKAVKRVRMGDLAFDMAN